MGSSASKAAQGTTRRFPPRAPGAAAPPPAVASHAARPSPAQKAASKTLSERDDAIRQDSMDPDMITADFSNRLRQMGVANPFPTFSPSSTASPPSPPSRSAPGPLYPPPAVNPALHVLRARKQLEQAAEDEFGSLGTSRSQGREFLDITTIRDVLVLRQRGSSAAEIESRLNLKPGVVRRLGPPGLVAAVGGAAP